MGSCKSRTARSHFFIVCSVFARIFSDPAVQLWYCPLRCGDKVKDQPVVTTSGLAEKLPNCYKLVHKVLTNGQLPAVSLVLEELLYVHVNVRTWEKGCWEKDSTQIIMIWHAKLYNHGCLVRTYATVHALLDYCYTMLLTGIESVKLLTFS